MDFFFLLSLNLTSYATGLSHFISSKIDAPKISVFINDTQGTHLGNCRHKHSLDSKCDIYVTYGGGTKSLTIENRGSTPVVLTSHTGPSPTGQVTYDNSSTCQPNITLSNSSCTATYTSTGEGDSVDHFIFTWSGGNPIQVQVTIHIVPVP